MAVHTRKLRGQPELAENPSSSHRLLLTQVSSASMFTFLGYSLLTIATAFYPIAVGVALGGTLFGAAVPQWAGIVYFLVVTISLYVIGPVAGSAQLDIAFRIGFAADRQVAAALGKIAQLDDLEDPQLKEDLELYRSRQQVMGEALARGLFAAVTLLVPVFIVVSSAVSNRYLLLLVPACLPAVWAGMRVEKNSEKAEAEMAPCQVKLAQLSQAIEPDTVATELRTYGATEWYLEQYRGVAREWATPGYRANSTTVLLSEGSRTLYFVVVCLILGVSLRHGDTSGAVMALLASFQLYSVLSGLRFAYRDLAQLRRELRRFHRILDYPSSLGKVLVPGERYPGQDAVVTLRDVHYSYPQNEGPALTAVSLSLPAHSLIAVIGENGSGKSTLAQLLRGVRRPTSGSITWRNHSGNGYVAGVPQNPTHWEFEAYEVATLPQQGDNEPFTNESEAIRQSGAGVVLASLPNGANTRVGDSWPEPHELSGGQWQRLGNARGLLGSNAAELTVVDEPTSALDPLAEAQLVASARHIVDANESGGSVVMITHRMATALNSDYVVMLHHGEVVAHGEPSELCQGDNPFGELVRDWKESKE